MIKSKRNMTPNVLQLPSSDKNKLKKKHKYIHIISEYTLYHIDYILAPWQILDSDLGIFLTQEPACLMLLFHAFATRSHLSVMSSCCLWTELQSSQQTPDGASEQTWGSTTHCNMMIQLQRSTANHNTRGSPAIISIYSIHFDSISLARSQGQNQVTASHVCLCVCVCVFWLQNSLTHW